METATKSDRTNLNLPTAVHERLKRLATKTHRTLVGVVDWLATEAEKELESHDQPAPVAATA